MQQIKPILLALLLVPLFAAGCGDDNADPTGLAETELGLGPRVIFDIDAKPLPELPFPNDVATRRDPTTVTGRRVNISMIAPTRMESELRELADKLDGWGTFAPISVSFDAPIDAVDVHNRQNDDDPMNDAIFLVNIDRDSEDFGEFTPLDVGGGRYPVILRDRSKYFSNDPRAGESNLLFETVDEDINRDGILQPEEDTDFDGVLDKPNTFPGMPSTIDDLMTHYEAETHTLIARPLIPLRQQTTYAVVLTKRITAEDKRPDDGVEPPPIRSPFEYINHTRQNTALEPLAEVLTGRGLTVKDVAFTWTFTTQTVTYDLEVVRRGLYGHGVMGWLADAYPANIQRVERWRHEKSGSPTHLVFGENFAEIISFILPIMFSEDDVPAESAASMADAMLNIDYIVSGDFNTPNFLVDKDGLATEINNADSDEIWEIDALTGEAIHGPERVTWWCAIPREENNRSPGQPFPVVLYGHGHTSARMELLGFAGAHARAGLASCALDAQGHGLAIPPDIAENPLIQALLDGLDLERGLEALTAGRARDLNNDGLLDSGADYWSANTFHTRDVVRQSVVDWLMFIRILRSFDGVRQWELEDTEGSVALTGIAGDFDGDGTVDLGGWDNKYYVWGQSLGGFVSAIALAVEPCAVAGAPGSAGAGLLDVAMRTTLGGVVDPVWLRLMGPLVVTFPNPDNPELTDVFWEGVDVNDATKLPIATLPASELAPGDTIRVTNMRSEEFDLVRLPANQRTRLAVAADAMDDMEKAVRFELVYEGELHTFTGQEAVTRGVGDPFVIEIFDTESGALKRRIDTFEIEGTWQRTIFSVGSALVNPSDGFGFKRQSPDMRRFIGLGQSIIEPADPANYAATYTRPLDFTDIEPNCNQQRRALIIATLGDMSVPISTGVAVGRAAGILSMEFDERWGKSPDQLMVDNFVFEGVPDLYRFGPEVGRNLYDPDNLDNDLDGYGAPSPAIPVRATITNPDGSESGMRLPYIFPEGEHGFLVQSPHKDFDIDTFMANQISWYFAMDGMQIIDDPCLADYSCDFIPPIPPARDL